MEKRSFTPTLLVTLLLLGMAACAPAKKSSNVSGETRTADFDLDDALIVGEYEKAYKQTLQSPYLEPCDQKVRTFAEKIAILLDQKQKEILGYHGENESKDASQSKSDTQTLQALQFGKSYLIENTAAPQTTTQWSTYSFDWSQIQETYEKIKDQPINSNWISLNASVSAILLRDYQRLLSQPGDDTRQNMALDHLAAPKLEAILVKMEACIQDQDCKMPSFTASDDAFILSVPFYRDFKKSLSASPETSEARKILEKFRKRLNMDADRFRFSKNELMTAEVNAAGKNIFHIPLNGSDFDDAQKEVYKKFVETMWRDDQNEVKVEWKNVSDTNLFKVLFDLSTPYGLSRVNLTDKIIQIYPGNTNRMVAHETGHAMGFQDHYYTLWDDQKCVYTQEMNLGDLMSSNETGSVTRGEWKALQKAYLNKKENST